MNTHISSLILGAVLAGVGATVIMDLWALMLRRLFSVPSLSYCIVGRWLSMMPRGTFMHANMAAVPKAPAECVIGWVAHYALGVAFALGLGLVLLAPAGWLEQPTVMPALLFGIGTVVIPFFIMQPCLGMGIAAAKSANPLQARVKSVMTHAVFGFGLYASALVVSRVMQWDVVS